MSSMVNKTLPTALPTSLESLLLSIFPAGTRIIRAQSYRPDYLLFPMCIQLKEQNGSVRRCVVKIKQRNLIDQEARALRILRRTGLPVPELLSEPIPIPSDDRALIVLSELPGEPAPWCGITSLEEADQSCRLVLEAIHRLHAITSRLFKESVEAMFPHVTLDAEYTSVVEEAGKWLQVSLFRRAAESIRAAVANITTPLVFSNGDYNPLNFLTNGGKISGFVDFEGACFENPLIGFAKFLIWKHDTYGWGTGAKVGLVERYLYSQNISRRDFAPVLVLRCLRHLVRDTSIEGLKDQQAREHILQVVSEGLQIITQ